MRGLATGLSRGDDAQCPTTRIETIFERVLCILRRTQPSLDCGLVSTAESDMSIQEFRSVRRTCIMLCRGFWLLTRNE
jgi:hypothetical protein